MRLPREVVDSLFLKILKTQAGLALDSLLWLVLLPEGRAGPRYLQRCLLPLIYHYLFNIIIPMMIN